MKLFSVTMGMTEDVTPPMSQTMNLSRRRNVKRTSERIVSLIMRRLPSMRLLRSAELPLSGIVISKDLKFAELNMSLSAGLSRRNMMSLMMLLNAQLSKMRSVKMKLLVIPPSQNALSGLERFALSIRRLSRSTLPSLDVPRNPESSVLQQAVDSSKELRSVMTRPAPLSRMLPKRNVVLSLKELVAMLPNLSLNFIPLKSVLMYPRRSVPDQEPIPER